MREVPGCRFLCKSTAYVHEAKSVERRQYIAEQEAAATRATHSLSSLLDDHVKHQAAQGRISAREAKNIFDLHVVTAWPALAQIPAAEITQDQVIDMLRRLTEQGKGRTSNKLRTYLRAAFQCAVDVRARRGTTTGTTTCWRSGRRLRCWRASSRTVQRGPRPPSRGVKRHRRVRVQRADQGSPT